MPTRQDNEDWLDDGDLDHISKLVSVFNALKDMTEYAAIRGMVGAELRSLNEELKEDIAEERVPPNERPAGATKDDVQARAAAKGAAQDQSTSEHMGMETRNARRT